MSDPSASAPSSCCPPPTAIARFALGQLADGETDAVAAHLDVCVDCRASLAQCDAADDRMLRRLRDLPSVRPVAFDARKLADDVLAFDRSTHSVPGRRTPTSDDILPRSLGQYRLIECIGRGGMGVVYLAEHTHLRRMVAIKVLDDLRRSDPDSAERFRQEMRAIAALDHPNIVRATDANVTDGTSYLVMELLDGSDLSVYLREVGPIPVGEVVRLAAQTADGLAAAHAAGLIHRDIKPSNIQRTRSGDAKVLDLGLARSGLAGRVGLTDAAQILGTYDYMAPEQARDPRASDARSDLYSLGCTLFALLTGRPPYDSSRGTVASLLLAHQLGPIPSVRAVRPDVPARLDRLIHGLMLREPDGRPQTAEEVARRLRQMLPSDTASPAPVAPRPLWHKAIVAGAAILLAGLLAVVAANAPAPARLSTDTSVVPTVAEVAAEVEESPMPRERIAAVAVAVAPSIPAILPMPPGKGPFSLDEPQPPEEDDAPIRMTEAERRAVYLIGPFLYDSLFQATRAELPFEKDEIRLHRRYENAGRKLEWKAAGEFPKITIVGLPKEIPEDREGVYYLATWARMSPKPARVEWDGLKCTYKMEMFVNRWSANADNVHMAKVSPLAIDKNYFNIPMLWQMPPGTKEGWNEVILKVLVSPRSGRVPNLDLTAVRRFKADAIFQYFEDRPDPR